MAGVKLIVNPNVKGQHRLEEDDEANVKLFAFEGACIVNVLLGDFGASFYHANDLIEVVGDPGVHGASHVSGLEDPQVVFSKLLLFKVSANEAWQVII